MIKIGSALFEATEQLEREKGISKEVVSGSTNSGSFISEISSVFSVLMSIAFFLGF